MKVPRREFLKRAGGAIAATGTAVGLFGAIRNGGGGFPSPDARRRGLLRPPGSLAEDAFLARCIRCQRCAESCQPKAIRLAGPGAGRLDGTPYIVAESHACTLCLECGKACPTGAIAELAAAADARMGVAVVDKRLCVSHNQTGICGACYTVCPLRGKAIRQGAHNAPTIDPRHCVGCGLCEEACIVKGAKAIRALSPRRWDA